MTASKPSIVEGRVPIMAMTALDLRRLLGRRTTRNGDLQRVILRDPAAAIALFRYVRRLRRDAADDLSDAGHAVSMIGFDAVRRLLRQLPELQPNENDWLAPAMPFAFSQGAHAAFYARLLARNYGFSGIEEIATAALLQDPAVLALWSTEPAAAAQAARQIRAGQPFQEAYGELLGEPLSSANQWVAKTWGLPSLAVEALSDDPDIDRRAGLARLCAGLARCSSFDWHSRGTGELIEQLADFLHRPVDRIASQFRRASVQAARDLRPVGYPVAAFTSLLLTSETLGSNGPAAAAAATSALSHLNGALLDILQRVQTEAGLQRVAFVALHRARGQLRTHLALDVHPEASLHTLEVSSGERNLFSLLIAKPQSVWLHAGNRDRYAAFLTSKLDQALRAENCFAMSVFNGVTPLGLIYGDGVDLDGEGYERFRKLIREAGQEMNDAAA